MKNRIFILKFSLLVILFISLTNCNKTRNDFESLCNEWYQKRILLADNMVFTRLVKDTIDNNLNTNCKILFYVDSLGCTICKMKMYEWASFITEITNIVQDRVSFVLVINPDKQKNTLRELRSSLIASRFDYPIWLDMNDSLNKLNHFPPDERFHCFLLDSANRVILIGNPVQNPKIKELYIRTICERLGIDYNPQQTQDNTHEVNLGTFSISETKAATFPIRNSEQSEMVIDTLFSSCECTTAQINKNVIKPNETAILSVTYTPDGVGDFYREVYVKLKNKEKPLVFKIRGTVK